MKTFRLKSLAMTIAVLASSSLCAQFSKIGGFGYLDYYIGDYQGKELYQTVTNGLGGNKTTLLVAFSDSTFTVEKEKKVTASFQYLKWFVSNGSLYALTVFRAQDTLGIDLNRYDANYEVVEKTLVLKERGLDYDPAAMRVNVSGTTVAVAGNTDTKVTGGFIAVVDLATLEHYLQQFSFGGQKKLTCADILVNPRSEALAVFQGKEDDVTTGKQQKLQAFLVSCTRSNAALHQLGSLTADGYVRSFRLCGIDADNALLGGLFFSAKSRNMVGYYTAGAQFGTDQLQKENRVVAASLVKKELWSTKEGKKAAGGKRLAALSFQYLKEIQRLSDGSFVFVSEGHRVTSGGGGAGGMGVTGGVGNASSSGSISTLSTTTSSSNMSTGPTTILFDIIVSRLQADGTAVWSNKTKLREFGAGTSFTAGKGAPLYVLKMDEQQGFLRIYYPEEKKKFSDTGLLNEQSKKGFLLSHRTIAVMQVKLSDGNGVIRTFYSDFDAQPSESVMASASHCDADGNLVLVTTKSAWEAAYRKVVVRK